MSESGPILVVEDAPDLAEVICETLQDEGYAVAWADNGRSALDVLRRQAPALILLDLRMPGMDGREFLAAYRAMPGPHAPVVVMTAARDSQRAVNGLDIQTVLSKPFELDELVAVVARYVAV